MSVTPDVSHVEIWPYVASAAVGFQSHCLTASWMLLSVMTEPASAPRGLLKATTPIKKVSLIIILQLGAAALRDLAKS